MKHRTNKLSLLVSAIAICFALIFSGTPITMLAQTPSRTVTVQSQASPKATPTESRVPDLTKQDIQARINRDGKLPGGAAYRSLVQSKYGNVKTVRANVFATGSSPGNTVTQVGNQPQGFGQTFFWDRKDKTALLVAFINAADDLGLSIEGMKSGDSIEISSATGVASFAEDKGNPLASSLIGLLAVGGEGVAAYEEDPQLIPIIKDAEKQAQDLFKGTGQGEKFRDTYGVQPSNGGVARAEGGIIVCLPGSGGPYYAGDSDHEERWIKPGGTRDLAHMPDFIFPGTAFFPLRANPSQNVQTVTSDGEVYVLPWDSFFNDNAGFYKVFIILHKGNGPVPPIVLTKQGSVGKGGGANVNPGTRKVRQ